MYSRTLVSFVFILALHLTAFAHGSVKNWDLNDVSYLFPLPKSTNANTHLRPTTSGRFGMLLSKEAFATLPLLTDDIPKDQIYNQLRAVGIRIDPCFPEGCQAQIRIIYQPVMESNSAANITTADSAVHVFYTLSNHEFLDFASQLLRLKKQYGIETSGRALGVHPAFNPASLNPAFVFAFYKLILNFTGMAKVTKLTFMTGLKHGIVWTFGGFDVVASQVKPLLIPRINSYRQTFTLSPDDRSQFKGALKPLQSNDALSTLVTDSENFVRRADSKTVGSLFETLAQIENPNRHTPQTMDCASCHLAQPARVYLNQHFPSLAPTVRQYVMGYNLKNNSVIGHKVDVLRAFGYFMEKPSINQRAIYESAAVAERMNACCTR